MSEDKKFVLLQYATAHGLVDLGCVVSLFSIWHIWSPGILLMQKIVLLYGILAFGIQPFSGWLADYLKSPKLFAITGCLFVAFGIILLPFSFWLTVFLIGIGNAIFHIGGGIISLNLTPYKASAPGIFVAPGAMGLALGGLIGKAGFMNSWFFAGILIIMALILYIIKAELKERETIIYPRNKFWLFALFLFLIIVGGRALIGFSCVLPWKNNLQLFLILTAVISLGKGAGGILADRYGFKLIAILGLALSAPLIIFYSKWPLIVIPGIFMFQFTMPITLTAVYRLLPNRPGLAFGLPCFALFVGSVPVLTQNQKFFSGLNFLSSSFVLMLIIIYIGLKMTPSFPEERQV